MSLPASIYRKTRANCVAGEVVYDEKTIRTRVAQLGLKISTDYAGKELLVVGILKGPWFLPVTLYENCRSRCIWILSQSVGMRSSAGQGRCES